MVSWGARHRSRYLVVRRRKELVVDDPSATTANMSTPIRFARPSVRM